MKKSTITVDVYLDEQKIPEKIEWMAADSAVSEKERAKALLMALWDGADKTAMRIDLWTKDMMVDEMADFYYQVLLTMADTYERATHHADLVADMKKFAADFYKKFREIQSKGNT
ncbi:gliding motility protein GldC [Dinghuibacter silviterrae]|uniref:Gliding motility-associated protein GldC n=1 Tax=Dinghuibacter silviterrae TaxID=1539049 RepID=A0A4R8DPS4_9BACT|nr:gliding motility protein GldC [Dinghuibacter silviterrae]TDW99878.1 gliding motility-associated protein GldC [Dinghuibacter silviterrae]